MEWEGARVEAGELIWRQLGNSFGDFFDFHVAQYSTTEAWLSDGKGFGGRPDARLLAERVCLLRSSGYAAHDSRRVKWYGSRHILLSRNVDRRLRRRVPMAKYIPSPRDWVREQVELYENSGGTKGTTLRDTGLPVVLVTHWGNKTGAIRKTPLMRVKDGDNYILIGSQGGAPKDPAWAHNLRVNPHIELRDESIVRPMRVREVKDAVERARLWTLAVAAYPPYADYQARTERQIPVFVAEP